MVTGNSGRSDAASSSDAARALLRSAEAGIVRQGSPLRAPLVAIPGAFAVPLAELQAPPGADRAPAAIHEAGGQVLQNLLPPTFRPFELERRVLPDDSWFDVGVSPQRPVQFEIIGYKVPDQMHLWIYDYEFSVFRLSGIEAGDIVEAEAGRFSGQMGFDVTINGQRPGNLSYQLDPQPTSVTRQSFNTQGTSSGPTPTASQFTAGAFGGFASTAGVGQSLLPVRRAVQGPEGQPFTMLAKQGEVVGLSCVIFKRVRSPIACIRARIAGYLMQSNMSESLIERTRPR